jgi:hypothetical protein
MVRSKRSTPSATNVSVRHVAAHYYFSMSFDLARYTLIAAFFVLFAGVPAAAAIPAAVLSAPSERHGLMSRRIVVVGLFVSFAGVLMMGLGAWLGRDDSRYGVIEFIGMLLISLVGAGVLVAGLGSLPSWLLEIFVPYAERLPLPIRLAARDLVRRRRRAVLAITLAMVVTAFGIALTIIEVGQTTQSRAEYYPQARPGTLLVRSGGWIREPFSVADAGTVRAAIERELPGVPIAESERLSIDSPFFRASTENVEIAEEGVYWDQAIGDENLLRYLTGNQSTPYDEEAAVVITSADVKVNSVELSYEINKNDATTKTKTVQAVNARTTDPHMETIFIPSKIVRDLGYELQPDELIIDPALRRITVQERERLDDRLDDAVAQIYVERGFEASTWWLPVVAAALLLALTGALTAGVGQAANAHQARVLRRAGNGSATAFRWFCAFRAGLSALCGTVLGMVAGCPAGMLLLWPLTVRTTWDEPVRVPFETPWSAIVAMVAGLPLLAAALGALLARVQLHAPTTLTDL